MSKEKILVDLAGEKQLPVVLDELTTEGGSS